MLTNSFFKKNPDVTIHWPLNPLIQKALLILILNQHLSSFQNWQQPPMTLTKLCKSQLHKIIVFGKLKLCTDIGPSCLCMETIYLWIYKLNWVHSEKSTSLLCCRVPHPSREKKLHSNTTPLLSLVLMKMSWNRQVGQEKSIIKPFLQ